METGDHMDTHKFVSSSAEDSKPQRAELGGTENSPKSEHLIFSGGQHSENQPENFLFGSGTRKDNHFSSGADVNQFILHETRSGVPTNKQFQSADKQVGQTSVESKNKESIAPEKSEQTIPEDSASENAPSVNIGKAEEDPTHRISEIANNKLTAKEDSISEVGNAGDENVIQPKAENDRSSLSGGGGLLVKDIETNDSNKDGSETDRSTSVKGMFGDAVESKHNGEHVDRTETVKTDTEDICSNEKLKAMDDSFGVKPKEQMESTANELTLDEFVKGSSEKKPETLLESGRSDVQPRAENNRISDAEKNSELISHEADVKDTKETEHKNSFKNKHTDFIHNEQDISVGEKSKNESLEPADKLPPEQQRSDEQEGSTLRTSDQISDDDGEAEGWLDILGSGQLKKKIIKKAENSYRPQNLHVCEINLEGCLEDGTVVEKFENLKIQVGDVEVVQGIDLALPLMNVGEVAILEIGPRFAYGRLGRSPDIPPDATLIYTVELLSAESEPELELLSIAERKEIGNKKRERGNWWYSRQEYSFAIQSYRRAIEFLDEAEGGFSIEQKVVSQDTEKQLQDLLEDRLKVFNNLAAAQMKIKAYEAALTSVENVLRCQPHNVKALFRKGKILAAKGETAAALSILRNASQLEPDSKVIKQEMQRLLDVIKHDTKQEKSLYKKMLGQNNNAEKTTTKGSKISYRTWGIVCSSVAVVLLGAVAYRYKFL